MKFIIFTKKKWDIQNYKKLDKKKFVILDKLNVRIINELKPNLIFFIHWSQIVPSKIYENFYCIQFHSSDLPRFRGGSPIQNQIIRGIKKTKLTAFKIGSKIDCGDIVLKKKLSLDGQAGKIYREMEKTSIKMINIISKKKIKTYQQKGKSSYFKRRLPEESNLNKIKIKNLSFFYNFLRMLDADGYPNAFLNFNKYKISFKNINKNNIEITGNFKIEKK